MVSYSRFRIVLCPGMLNLLSQMLEATVASACSGESAQVKMKRAVFSGY